MTIDLPIHDVIPAHNTLKLKFQHWFPSYATFFNTSLYTECAREYAFYLAYDGTQTCRGCNIEPTISCLIERTSGYINANISSAQVLLGLLPSMLALAACTSAEIGVLALRRPFLAFLIAAASPAANPIRTAEYENPSYILQWRSQGYAPSRQLWGNSIVFMQYFLALAAIVNLASLCWELGLQTVLAWAPNSVIYPGAWALLALALHGFGTATVFLRVSLIDEKPHPDQSGFKRWARQEFNLSSSQRPARMIIRPESATSFLFPVMSWFASTSTVAHLIFGVFTFSAMLFIGFGDALKVVLRLMSSVILCRGILVYELSGLRRVVRIERSKAEDGDSELEFS